MLKERIRRYLIFILGVAICATGIAFITRAALGTSALSSVSFVLNLATGVKMGTFVLGCNMLFLVLEAVLMRRFTWVQALAIPFTFLFSACIDGAMYLIPTQLDGPIPFKVAYLLLGCAVMALGIALEVFGGVTMLPGESFVKAMADRFHQEFGNVKVAFDCTLTLIAATLALALLHRLNGVGIGTLVSALLVGQFVKLFSHKLSFIRDFCHPIQAAT